MKKTPVAIACMAILVGALVAVPATGQEPGAVEDLKAQIQRTTEVLKQQQALIDSLQQRLAELEKAQTEAKAEMGQKAGPPGNREAPPLVAEAKAASPKFEAGWKDGATTFKFPNAELKLANRMQIRWTQANSGDPETNNTGAFAIRRFKVQLTGWAYTPDLTFRVQADLANANTTPGILDDACVNYDFTRGRGLFQVTAGQFKIPFGRQALASTRTDMFADRSFVTYLFSSIRDVGVMAHGQFGPSGVQDLFEYSAGVFNGAGRSVYKNPDGKYKTDLRLVVSPWGSTGYDEANPFGSPKAKLSLGLGYEQNDTRERERTGAVKSGTWYETAGYDLMFKYRWFTAYGEYFDSTSRDRNSVRMRSGGLNAQLGFLVVPKRWEVFLGYWTFDPSRTGIEDRQKEAGIGTSVYFSGFNSKLQADLRKVKNDATPWSSYEFRLQYQILF